MVLGRNLITLIVAVPLATGMLFAMQMPVRADSPAPASSVSPAPSATTPDDKSVAARAKTWFGMLQSGKIDRSQLDKPMNDALPPDKVSAVASQIQPLGKPMSFTPIDKSVQGSITVYRYKISFGSGPSLIYTFALDPDGKIAGLFLTPA